MSGNDNYYTEEEKLANERADAWGVFAGVMIILAMLIYFVASH